MPVKITHGISKKKYTFQLEDVEKVINNLNKLIDEYKDKTLKGVLRAALLIRRKALELTPKDTGNLKESCFVVWKGGIIGAGKSPNFVTGGKRGATQKEVDILYKNHTKALNNAQSLLGDETKIRALINYSAYYALFVHEIKKQHKNGQWKFLETAIKQNQAEVLKIIAETVKSKGGGFTGESESF